MQKDILIVHSPSAEGPELNAILELQQDLNRTTENPVYRISTERLPEFNTPKQLILVGLQDTHPGIQKLIMAGKCRLAGKTMGMEGFVLESLAKGPVEQDNTLVITAGDVRGLLYGVYEFSSRVLHIDPFEFWTGKKALNSGLLELPELAHSESSPVFPLRGYFDNDNDMLSNWSGRKLTVEFETWKEMIDSLARLRYNYIDLHDTLGRAEFWYWDYYKDKFNYHTDLDLVEKLIDYIHGKGMLVQIPLYLGWEFYHLPYEKVALSKHHDDWMKVYEHYLKNTPLGKGDLFLQRPRDPWWDYAYNVLEEKEAGIKTGPLMNKMFTGLNNLIKKYRPEAKLICDLWMEGRGMWDAGEFDPDIDIDMLWADDGYAVFSEWPTDF
ncbi:hypothetical protein KAH55_10140 [bacterium]|nr:hypothetical protein [bacterium]